MGIGSNFGVQNVIVAGRKKKSCLTSPLQNNTTTASKERGLFLSAFPFFLWLFLKSNNLIQSNTTGTVK